MRRRKDTSVLHLGVGDRENSAAGCRCQHLDLWSSNILPSYCKSYDHVFEPLTRLLQNHRSDPPGPFKSCGSCVSAWLSYSTWSSGGTRSSSCSFSLNFSFSPPCCGPNHHTACAWWIEIDLGLRSDIYLLTMVLLSDYLTTTGMVLSILQTCTNTAFW